MELMSYRDALKAGKEKIDGMLVPIRTKRAKKKAELEMCKLEEEIAVLETKIHEECCKEDVSFTKIIDLQDELGLLERREAQYKKILEQMFPED